MQFGCQKLMEKVDIVFCGYGVYAPEYEWDDYKDIDEELLKVNNYLYEEAQTMDLSRLTLPTFFDKIVSEYAHEHG